MRAAVPCSISRMNRDDIAAAIRRAGIDSGDNLILHSSLKSLGQVDGGAGSVVGGILDAVGPDGNVMVPTFTYCLPIWSVGPFDAAGTPSRTGAVTEAVRLWPGAVRSFHPTHSVAVIGPDAQSITEGHFAASPIGAGSPFDRMHKRGARILMLGTNQNTNSSLHYCEAVAPVPYLGVTFTPDQDYERALFKEPDGTIAGAKIFEMPGCSRGFRAVEDPLRRIGVLRDVQIGTAASQLLDMRAMVEAVVAMLADAPALLLCRQSECVICRRRREFVESHAG